MITTIFKGKQRRGAYERGKEQSKIIINTCNNKFFFYLSIIVLSGRQAKWASEEAAIRHHNNMMTCAYILIAVALIFYFLLGRKLLINLGSIYKNLISSILPAIIGIIIWIIAFSFEFTVNGGYLLNSELWQLYSAYNGYSLFFLDESNNNNHYVFLLFSFLPTITMSFGMFKKVRAKDKVGK